MDQPFQRSQNRKATILKLMKQRSSLPMSSIVSISENKIQKEEILESEQNEFISSEDQEELLRELKHSIEYRQLIKLETPISQLKPHPRANSPALKYILYNI